MTGIRMGLRLRLEVTSQCLIQYDVGTIRDKKNCMSEAEVIHEIVEMDEREAYTKEINRTQ